MPSPRIPASPREAPITVKEVERPSARVRVADSPPGPRSSDSDIPDAVSTVTPASPGALMLGVGLHLERHLAPLAPRLAPARAVLAHQAVDLPAQARRQPAEEQHRRGARVGPVAHGHRADPAQLLPPDGRVEARRHPLAPGGRAKPGEVHHVGLLGQLPGAPHGLGRVGLVHRVDQHDLSQRSAASRAPSRCPWGAQISVARSVTTSGSTMLSRPGQVALAAGDRDLLGPGHHLAARRWCPPR